MPFTVSNGKILDPSGAPWIGAGINAFVNADPAEVVRLFPKATLIRCPTPDLSDPSGWDSFVAYMSARKIVCEIESHPWPLVNAATGQELANKAAWYGRCAQHFAGNDYVIFGSPNEPQGGDLSAEHVAVVNAIRGAGNNTLVLLMGGVGGGNPGATGPAVLRSSAYASMRNVGWGLHCYGWASKFSTNQADVNNVLLGNSTDTGIRSLQTIHSADGVMPVVIDEFGPSTTGASTDANAAQVIEAVTVWAVQQGLTSGYSGWNWDADPFNAVQVNGTLTAWGKALAAAIVATAGAPVMPPSPDWTTITKPSDPPIIDATGASWAIIAANNQSITRNGVATVSSNVALCRIVAGVIYQQNTSGGVWAWQGGAWAVATMPIQPTQPPVVVDRKVLQAKLDQAVVLISQVRAALDNPLP